MKGIQHIEVSNRDAKFKFDLYRNLTIVRGDSGTGKTTLYEMIADYTRLHDKSGVNISSPKNCVALMDLDWKNQLNNISDSIVFIDEGFEDLRKKEFAEAIKGTDNYYVIFSRESLKSLPYSVEEIYEIKTSGRYHSFKKMFKANKKHIYYKDRAPGKVKYDSVLVEDTKSGYQLYKFVFQDKEISCDTAGNNSGVFAWLRDHRDKKVFVIADGAAFGPYVDKVLKLQKAGEFWLCLPESFEWLILKSGLIRGNDNEINDVLEEPSAYIESSQYFSWEKFFEHFLIEESVNTPFQYAKSELPSAYLNDVNSKRIVDEIL